MFELIKSWNLTHGDSLAAWEKCLPFWRSAGGVNDWRGVIGQPFYSPSMELRLARRFAKRHWKNAAMFFQYTQSDPVTAVCAIDLLLEMAAVAPQIIPMLTQSELPLSEALQDALKLDAEVDSHMTGDQTPRLDTVGSFFSWQLEPGKGFG